jgi:PKD repeat protein
MKPWTLFLLACLCNRFTAQTTASIVACYALNGNGYEAINNLNGILRNVNASPGKLNTPDAAIHFKGLVNSFIEIPNTGPLKPNSISFSGWIKPVAGFVSKSFIVHTKSSGTNNSEAYSLSFEDSPSGKKFRVRKVSGSNVFMAETSVFLSVNNWYHVCFSIDTTAVKLYLNSVLQNTVSSPGPFSYHSTKSVYIGSNGDTTANNSFTGDLDNIRFYSGVLSQAEVTNLYNSYSSCIPATQPPVASFSLSPPFCMNANIQTIDFSTGIPDTWKWLAPGGLISNSNDIQPVISYSTAGNHTTSLIVSNSLGADTIRLVTFINPLPVVLASPSKTLVCRHEAVTLTAVGADTYSWSNGYYGNPAVVTPTIHTTYTVSGADTNGCIASGSVRVWVAIDCWNWPTHVKNETGNDVIVFPNPFKDKLYVQGDVRLSEFEVLDILGNLLRRGTITGSINLEGLPDGYYFLKLRGGGASVTVKIIKEE